GEPISEKTRREALAFTQTFDFDRDGLDGVLDTFESLIEPIIPLLAGERELLMRADQPARPSESSRPNDCGD
ncbi:MAG TPA: hypothetical protein VK481_14370, partial [Gemmatimonadaceae bacterium]|nr:hypothetical protein [Gemmatimonadaceae bacterium]